MILGIDIGGTHTDAVCVKDNQIVATAKVITGENLVDSIVGGHSRPKCGLWRVKTGRAVHHSFHQCDH